MDHTSEITLRLHAPSYSCLLAEAARAFAELAGPARHGAASDDEWREFGVAPADRAAQLVEWINELVYLSEAEQWLAVEVDVSTESEDSGLRIRARGVDLAEPFVLVKAATFHNATVQDGPLGWEGEVTLDV